MCGCRDCNNCPRSRSGMRRDERKEWERDFSDEQIYPELEETDENVAGS